MNFFLKYLKILLAKPRSIISSFQAEPEGEDEPECEARQGGQEDDDAAVPAMAAVAEIVVGIGGGI